MKAVRPVVLAAFFGLSWSIAELARAEAPEHASASLVYSAPIACPSSSELSRAVAERLGYEPFREGAEKTISVKIDATKSRRFRGRIEVRKGAASAGERDLPEEPDCAELVRAAALLVALQIDPLAGARDVPSNGIRVSFTERFGPSSYTLR